MTAPLLCLAVLSAIGGFIGIPRLLHHHHGVHAAFHAGVATVSTLVALLGLGVAYMAYVAIPTLPQRMADAWWPMHRLLVRKCFIDELYDRLVIAVQDAVAWLCALFERWVLIGVGVNGVTFLTRATGQVLRFCQTGHVQTYGAWFLAGIVMLVLAYGTGAR